MPHQAEAWTGKRAWGSRRTCAAARAHGAGLHPVLGRPVRRLWRPPSTDDRCGFPMGRPSSGLSRRRLLLRPAFEPPVTARNTRRGSGTHRSGPGTLPGGRTARRALARLQPRASPRHRLRAGGAPQPTGPYKTATASEPPTPLAGGSPAAAGGQPPPSKTTSCSSRGSTGLAAGSGPASSGAGQSARASPASAGGLAVCSSGSGRCLGGVPSTRWRPPCRLVQYRRHSTTWRPGACRRGRWPRAEHGGLCLGAGHRGDSRAAGAAARCLASPNASSQGPRAAVLPLRSRYLMVITSAFVVLIYRKAHAFPTTLQGTMPRKAPGFAASC